MHYMVVDAVENTGATHSPCILVSTERLQVVTKYLPNLVCTTVPNRYPKPGLCHRDKLILSVRLCHCDKPISKVRLVSL